MARKKKGLPIHGWLIIDKPLGMTSNAVVGKVRYLTKAQKVGHAGTLDPLASGVLPLALGEATKTVSFAVDGIKTYEFQVRWGEKRTTDDLEGEVEEISGLRPEKADIEAALPEFTGEISQTPPAYSAIKINGQRAYKLARDDQDVEMPSRTVHIHDLRLIALDDSDHARFEVTCSKGTYVRALGRDLGAKLGCLGTISMLRRTKVGNFTQDRAISLETLEQSVHSGALSEHLLSLETVLDDIPALALDEEATRKTRQGMPLKGFSDQLPPLLGPEDCVLLTHQEKAVALARFQDGLIRPFRVFNF